METKEKRECRAVHVSRQTERWRDNILISSLQDPSLSLTVSEFSSSRVGSEWQLFLLYRKMLCPLLHMCLICLTCLCQLQSLNPELMLFFSIVTQNVSESIHTPFAMAIYFWQPYAGGKLKHIFTRLLFRRVDCIRYEVPWFVDLVDVDIICHLSSCVFWHPSPVYLNSMVQGNEELITQLRHFWFWRNLDVHYHSTKSRRWTLFWVTLL
jgi:hypothetical protein